MSQSHTNPDLENEFDKRQTTLKYTAETEHSADDVH